MLAELKPDVAVICAPHPFHPRSRWMPRGRLRMCWSKSRWLSVGEADTMIAAAERRRTLAGGQLPAALPPGGRETIRGLIDAGELGALVRVLCIEPWYRPAAYYSSASWRGTWTGRGRRRADEPGAAYARPALRLAGLPHKVWGWTRTIDHAVDSRILRRRCWSIRNGAPGYLDGSTVEHGVQPQLQIAGEKGTLELVGNTLTIHRTSPSTREYMFSSQEMFGHPDTASETLDLADTSGGHQAVYRDFIAAIQEGRQPRSNGREGLMSLELTNGLGVNYVVEVGGPGTLAKSMQSVAYAGRIALIGVLAGFQGDTNPHPIMRKGASLRGSLRGQSAMLERMNAAIEVNGMEPVVDKVFAFDEALDAYRFQQSGAHFGKVVIRI